jgi:hypothetical protein
MALLICFYACEDFLNNGWRWMIKKIAKCAKSCKAVQKRTVTIAKVQKRIATIAKVQKRTATIAKGQKGRIEPGSVSGYLKI